MKYSEQSFETNKPNEKTYKEEHTRWFGHINRGMNTLTRSICEARQMKKKCKGRLKKTWAEKVSERQR